jgi:transcriptional regulator with XRE-family HTH domain
MKNFGHPTGCRGDAMPTREWDDSFGSLLARLRHAAGLTQEQLADRADLSVRAISSLECGSRLPRRLTLDRLAGALGLSAVQRGTLAATAARDRRPPAPGPVGALLPIAGPAVGPLTGRAVELAELAEHLHGDGPAVLAYDGEPGVGKSRLLAEVITLATGRGTPVLAGVGRCGGEPYAPFADALADHVRRTPARLLGRQLAGCTGLDLLLPELHGQLPGVPAQPPAQAQRLVSEAVARFLTNIAGTDRLLLVLDDLQWAGPQAAELLGYLVRRNWATLRVVTASRAGAVATSAPLSLCAAELARLHQMRGQRLTPLAAADADALVTAVAGGAPLSPADRARILRRAGGLPLYLVELTGAALCRGSARGSARIPWHLRMAVVQQLATLPEPVVRILRRMAVARPITVAPETLVTAELGAEQVLDQLDTARRHRVVEETRAGFRFRYPLVREVLATGLGPARRRLWRGGTGHSHAAGRRHFGAVS